MELVEEVPARVLAVYAHPDDPEVSAGGTLARWAAAGAVVRVLITTRGEKGSTDPHVDTDALARRRVDEAAAAAALLGFETTTHLEHPDGELTDVRALCRDIVRQVREHRPDAVLCPDPTAVLFGDQYYNHADHRATGFATLDAIAPAARNPHYFPELLAQGLDVHTVDTVFLSGTLEPNCAVDISESMEAKIEALFCHASQLTETGEWFRQFLRERAEDAGRSAGVACAETFRRLRLGG